MNTIARPRHSQPVMPPLNMLGLCDIQAQLAAGHCTSTELVSACLARIAAREQDVGAWAWLDTERALQQAQRYDGMRPTGRHPLAGIPVGIKDVIDTLAMPTSYGSAIYARNQPTWNAYCVAAIENAGGIILGKTTTSEFAHSAPSATRNPHGLGHTPGGSSSGSAACVADFMVPAALATQTGGSTIRPAAFCGIVGYKPSFGMINRSGVKLVAESLDAIGIMARTVADVQLLAGVLTPLPSFHPARSAPRIGFYRTPYWNQVDFDCQDALLARLQRLARHGARVSSVPDLEVLRALYQDQRDIMNYEAARAMLFEFQHYADQLSDQLRENLESGWAFPRESYTEALERACIGRMAFARQVQDYDVLVTPSAPGAAPAGLASSGTSLFNRSWSLLGVPTLSLPNGANTDQLPLGVQLVGRLGGDAELLHWASWIEARS
ncbi:MAG TPA: amidase [Bordetella sp.]|nr:amidase [Bordetella sp.]